MQFKKAMLTAIALCVPAAPVAAIASAASASHPTRHERRDVAAARARARHVALHRLAAQRNVRLARIRAHRLGHALAASYGSAARARSLEDLRRSNERLRAQLDRLRREDALVDRLRPSLRAIAYCESHHDPDAVSASGTYRGLFQFDTTAWHAAGGHGDPAEASVHEQYLRAAITYSRRGRAPWPVCGRWA